MSLSRARWTLSLGLLTLALNLSSAAPAAAVDDSTQADQAASEKTEGEKAVVDKASGDKASGDKAVAEKPAAASPVDVSPPREITVYIPYEKLRQTFEKEGRGVFIPYERFQELWKAACEPQQKQSESEPPSPAVIATADNDATVEKEVVRVVARLKIDLLKSGWLEVPLRLDDAGIISAKLIDEGNKEEPARLEADSKSGYKLIVENKSKTPRVVELRLEYAKPFTKTPGRNDVSFDAPLVTVNRWTVRVAEKGAKIHIDPMIAASDAPSGDDAKVAANPKGNDASGGDASGGNASGGDASGGTVLMAFVGVAPKVHIDWTAKAEGASGMSALATAEIQEQTHVEEAALRTQARLIYTISRAELPSLEIEVPADQKVVNVAGANVRQWSVEAGGKTQKTAQKITVQLFDPARQSETVDIELVQYGDRSTTTGSDKPTGGAKPVDGPKAADGAKAPAKQPAPKQPARKQPEPAKQPEAEPAEPAKRTVDVPVVEALGVARQQGVVVVDAGEGLQVEARERDGLSQLDAADLPAALAKGAHELSYRYAGVPFRLTLDVVKTKPRVLADELTEAYLEPDRLTLKLHAVYTIERAGVFDLAFDIPSGFAVQDVRGEDGRGVKELQVESHHLEGADRSRMVVNLAHKALGRVGLYVELQKTLEDRNLLSPTGKSAEIPLNLPRTAPDTIERTDGRLLIYAPESLRANAGKQSGLRSVSVAEALAGASQTPSGEKANLRPLLSFVYSKSAIDFSLVVERRKPFVMAGQFLVAKVDPGVVRYDATFFYDIRYSGVKSLRIDVPAELASAIRNVTPGISEHALDPAPKDVEKGDVAWSFSGDSELIGSVAIHLTWQRPIEHLEIGKSVELAIPRLRPRDVDRAWGQIVMEKAESIDLAPSSTPSGLRPIDPQHDLMPGGKAPDAAQAFEFQGDWSLAIAATRYQLQAIKHTSIERGLVRAVITRGGQMAVQALYRVRSSEPHLAIRLPTGVVFDTEPLRIDGHPISLQTGAQEEYFVSLNGQSGEQPFLLELRYTLSGAGKRIELPSFPDEPAVQKVYLAAFLPNEQRLLGYRGPWTNEQQASDPSIFAEIRSPRKADLQFIDWVQDGINLQQNLAASFPVDGQLYLFSTLRPDSGDAGSLRLTTLDGHWLDFLLFVVVVGLGLAMLRQRLATRGFELVALVILLLLLGVFIPTFTMQILGAGFWLALLITALTWLIAFMLQRANRSRPAAVVAGSRQASPPTASGSSEGNKPPPEVAEKPGAENSEKSPGDASQEGPSHG